MREIAAFLFLAAMAPVCAQPPIVSSLHTVSVHIDSPATYNALLRFFENDLQWPVIYGTPWTPDRQNRRSYAGIWAGNVVLEICGPYPGETFPGGVRARLHGLTFRPRHSASESVEGLRHAGILYRPPFDTADGNLRFVVLSDPALISPALSVSIMEVRDRGRERTEQDAARARLAANHGGPLGLRSVTEIRVACPGAASLAKWRQLLVPERPETGGGPGLRFVEGSPGELSALVLRVASARKAVEFLESVGSGKVLTAGVRIICTE